MQLPTIFESCRPRDDVLAGELPDALFAADLWDVITGRAHSDYRDPQRFFAGTHPTENIRLLLREVSERLSGTEGGNPVFRLETGFGGGKTHTLIAAVHLAREGSRLGSCLSAYGISRLAAPGSVAVAAFVGEESDPLAGGGELKDHAGLLTYTPWGQIALMAGGLKGYNQVRENDEKGVAPSRSTFESALGDGPLLILIDELVLYMARAAALHQDHPRSRVNSQFPTFFQTLFAIAARRPKTSVLFTLPSEQDANRKLTGQLKQYLPSVLSTVDELEHTAGRNVRNLTPTQANERAAVLARRLFERVDSSRAADVSRTYAEYYVKQGQMGATLDSRAFDSGYIDQIRTGYPFHPELIRLFSERLADIPDFQSTRGALRLVARTIRAAWENRSVHAHDLLLHPHHVDLSKPEIRDEILSRLGKGAFVRGLEADVIKPGGGTHSNQVEAGWPWPAASESCLAVFLHSLPDGSRGLSTGEVSLAVGRPDVDLAYVGKGLEDTERRAWYMRRENDHFLFRTRASVNKRFQEQLANVAKEPGIVRSTLDEWIAEVYSGFESLQVILFPSDHTAIPDIRDKIRLAVIHYDVEAGEVGRGSQLSFVSGLFQRTGVNASPRRYRNNLVFLLAEKTRISGLRDSVAALIAWERVRADVEAEQRSLAEANGADFKALKEAARRGASGVSGDFLALENDYEEVTKTRGVQELNVRSLLLEAYRVLAFPPAGGTQPPDLFESTGTLIRSLLECYRVDFGETPAQGRKLRDAKQTVAETPLLQCLRDAHKLLGEPTEDHLVVLAPEIVGRPPIWFEADSTISTEEVWDRIRREPDAPMVLRPSDVLPTFRAGLISSPDVLWIYYDSTEKRVYTRHNASDLSPVLSSSHLLYRPVAAARDRIHAPLVITPQEVWDHLWRSSEDAGESISTRALMDAAKGSHHFPVIPEKGILWSAIQEGVNQKRWVVSLVENGLVIGQIEVAQLPQTPRIDEKTVLLTTAYALESGLYPPHGSDPGATPMMSTVNVKALCWPADNAEVSVEELQSNAVAIWASFGEQQLDQVVRKGLLEGLWCVKCVGDQPVFYAAADHGRLPAEFGPGTTLVKPDSALGSSLEALRPGRRVQPIVAAGTPREAVINVLEGLSSLPDVAIDELQLCVVDRRTLDNTLAATWPDRPKTAFSHVSVSVNGRREHDGQTETVGFHYEGRFEEVRSLLAPLWSFESLGELVVSVALVLSFTPISAASADLRQYLEALMDANQGELEIRILPSVKVG